MKILKIVLMVALALGVVSVFAGAVSAADQTNNPLIAKGENVDIGAAPQTTGKIESGNVSKIDLNAVTKPEPTVNVENSTISEPAKADATDITPVQNVSNTIGKEENSSDLQSENSQELTTKGMKSIKAQGWVDDLWNTGKAIVNKITEPIRWVINGNNSDVEYYPNGKVKRNKTSNCGSNLSIPKIPI